MTTPTYVPGYGPITAAPAYPPAGASSTNPEGTTPRTPQFGGDTINAASTPVSIEGLPDKKRQRYIDFEYNLANFTGTTGQSIALMDIPPMTQVDTLQVINHTLIPSGVTISVGDSTSTTKYVNGATPTTALTVLTQAITTNPLNFYGAAATTGQPSDTLNLTVTTSTLPTSGILRFVLNLTDCSRNATTTNQ